MLNRERKPIDITAHPEWLRLVREMERADQPLSLREDDREVAVLSPAAKPATSRRRRKTGILTKDDPLWDLVGMIHSDGPGDVADNVDKYLAEASLTNDA